jgi:YD repeat-containing protein
VAETATDAHGNTTALAFDAAGRVVGVTDAVDTHTRLVCDLAGRVLEARTVDRVATYAYSLAGRMVACVEPGDAAWTATFGAAGDYEVALRATRSSPARRARLNESPRPNERCLMVRSARIPCLRTCAGYE